ncbi:MAG: DHH family phosphoesterase, partial [Chloroflexi bacterium]|nr:DHH family phosphoesterase [Chloroflexota bacterium]
MQTAEDAELFLNADERLLNDPKMLPDMPKAVERLRQALDGGEHIAIFGDFDADGITGTALLTTALRSLGAKVTPLLPNRADEGHGLNTRAVNLMAEGGASLLITVDCGTTSVDEVDQAAELGIDTIITDHHTVLPQVPASHALINPRHPDSLYPFGGLTGVGMSFKLIEALYGALDEDWPEHLLEFVALGTVADVGPLQGENRFLVKRGLESLNRTDNPGIQALAGSARMNMGTLDTESLSFGIIPRLNVPGRLSDPKVALHLLTTDSADVARSLADEIEHLNCKRQELTHRAVAEAEAQV